MDEPKKETVRITLPPRPGSGHPGVVPIAKPDTVRVNPPSDRSPAGPASSSLDQAPSKGTARVPAVKPPTLVPKPFLPPSAPAAGFGGKPPSPPTVPRPPFVPGGGATPAAPRPPMAAPGAAAAPTIPVPAAGMPTAVDDDAPTVAPPPSSRPPVITGRIPTPATVPVPIGDYAVTRDEGENVRIEAPPAPIRHARERMPPPPTAASTVVSPSTVEDVTATPTRDGGVPLWASIVVFVLALAAFGVQLALYLVPALE